MHCPVCDDQGDSASISIAVIFNEYMIYGRGYGIIDLRSSFVIGDHPHDVEFAAGVGATGIYVLSGHGNSHRAEVSEHAIVVDGIREAAEQILRLGFHALAGTGHEQHPLKTHL